MLILGCRAAMFVNVKSGSWRYMLGSSLVFSTIMLVGMVFMPESPRMLMHKNKPLLAFAVWKQIRGVGTDENKREFFIMHHAVDSDTNAGSPKTQRTKMVWLDFFTNPRARRSIIYANIMIMLGQLTGVNAILCASCSYVVRTHTNGNQVLPFHAHAPGRIRHQDICIHVACRWWKPASRHNPWRSLHGEIWPALLGPADPALLLRRLDTGRHFLPHDFSRCHRRTVPHGYHYLHGLLWILRLPHLGSAV